MNRYVLGSNGEPVPFEGDLSAWATQFEHADNTIALDIIGQLAPDEVRVSTIFLGIDHNHLGDGAPVLFETMIFGGPLDSDQRRSSTRIEALDAHRDAVTRAWQRRLSDQQKERRIRD